MFVFRRVAVLCAAMLLLIMPLERPVAARQTPAISIPPPLPSSAPLPPPPAWDALKAAYAYDAAKTPVVTTAPRSDEEFVLVHLSFTNSQGQMVPALFLRPKGDKTRFPVALLLHGLGSDKETMIRAFGRVLAREGIACFALDADGHGERKRPGTSPGTPVAINPALFINVMKNTVVEYRQALDHLQTRPDVDKDRIGLLGYSMGAMMGAILPAVDARVKGAVLCVGGDPIRPLLATAQGALRASAETISPSNFIGHISPRPVFLINARGDRTIKPESAKRLQDAAGEPKTIVWVEGGHILAPAEAKKGVDWLVGTLKTTR